jgi:2-methylcitrate dehydratase PrpD
MASKSSPTQMLAEFVANVGRQPLPDAVRVKAAEIILDTLGCGIAAWRDDRARRVVSFGTDFGHLGKYGAR